MKKIPKQTISFRFPADLLAEIREEAELRGCEVTAVVEERLRGVMPLHEKLDLLIEKISGFIEWDDRIGAYCRSFKTEWISSPNRAVKQKKNTQR